MTRPRFRGDSTRRGRNALKPALERVEPRELLSGVTINNGIVAIAATDKGDSVFVSIDDKATPSPFDDAVKVVWGHGAVTSVDTYPQYKLVTGPYGGHYEPNVTLVQFLGGKGDDVFANFTSIRSNAVGGDGDDSLSGGDNNDALQGGNGSDKLYGRGGDDFLYGATFNFPTQTAFAVDTFDGSWGDDMLVGASNGSNIMHGGPDDDFVMGGAYKATNYLYGDSGDDRLRGGYHPTVFNQFSDHDGADTFVGGTYAANVIFCDDGVGDDKIYIYQTPLNIVYRDNKPAAKQVDGFTVLKGNDIAPF